MPGIKPRVALALLATLALASAGPGFAGVGDPCRHTVPTHVNLVGWSPAGPDSAAGHFEILIRDIANNPIPNAIVRLEFPELPTSDLRLPTDQPDPRLHVDCAQRSVWTLTDIQGRASFTLVGGGRNPHGPTQPGSYFLLRYYDEPVCYRVTVGAFDLDGWSGMTGADLARFGADLFSGTQPGRADYDGDGQVTALDLSIWGQVFFAGGSTLSGANYCP